MLATGGCAPLMPTLGPRLHDNAVAYDTAISDINNRVLLANIVRARDYVPLSITELSTVTGTLSEQATLGLSVPFGGNYGSTPRGTASPSVQLGTAPTFSMAALNTRSFTLNIIQPISPVYVASKWNSGIAHELLLLLFVKDIHFADSYALSAEDCEQNKSAPAAPGEQPSEPGGAPKLKPLVACHHKFINDPDSPGEERAFKAVVESMLPNVGIKVMTILDPIGPPFPFLSPGAGPEGSAKKSEQNPLDAYLLATHLADGQYHIGNDEQNAGRGQLYRVFANQVAVCANDPIKTADGTFYIYPVSADIAAAAHAQTPSASSPGLPIAQDWEDRLESLKSQCAASTHTGEHACHAVKSLKERPRSTSATNAFASYSLVRSAVGAAAAGEVQQRAVSRGGESGVSEPAEVAASLQHDRVGAFLRADDCYADQTIREPATEGEFRKYTETLGHIEWRSIAEVFQYLGAVLRQENGVRWDVARDRDVVGSTARAIPDTMFVLRHAGVASAEQAMLRVNYGGENVAIGSGTVNIANEALQDHSLLVLSLLSELVNSAKISSDIPVTQQLQVLP